MYRIAGYFRGVYISRISREHNQFSKIKILTVEAPVQYIREITFHEQELNSLFAKYMNASKIIRYTVYSHAHAHGTEPGM